MSKFFSAVSTVLIIILLIVALGFVVPILMGLKELCVLSGSMEPEIPVGSIVCIDTKVSPKKINEGDIVTYSAVPGTFVTHRVVSVDADRETFITKGDANKATDGEIAFSALYGKVRFHIPYLGYISGNIHTPKGIMAATVFIIIIILLNMLPSIMKKDGDK